ncbi:hypothetical protein A6P39_040370 [Streptomyces sp. FXJ1.172]|uniref:hypothetical protein n=1 Tax=Streptomyces sp. FXJ1.172 TaxID=710705 RepID=UPI0007CF739B
MPLGELPVDAGAGLVPGHRPLLLLDVDGVLREHVFFPGEEPPVRPCDAHGPWLADLGREFELAWATAWEDEANTFVAPVLNLPTLPVVRFPPVPFDSAEKVPAIDTFAGDRPAVWVDDVLTPEAWTWAHCRTVPTLLVTTNPAHGLTSQMVLELLA